MPISLEELKRQRAQIRKHLDWLDAKIREQSPEGEPPEAAKTAPATAPAEPEPATEIPVANTETKELVVPEVEVEGQVYQPKTQNELFRAKVGCVLFFVLAIVLFLFLLFGLPYYL